MLRVDRSSGTLTRLSQTTLSEAQWGERSELQLLLFKNADAFFEQECFETLFVINEEVEPSKLVGDRIDLLAIDAEGRAVVLELKRGSHKLQLLQSLTYAAMISEWSRDDFIRVLPSSKQTSFQSFETKYDLAQLNETQRIILIAESFDYQVLQTAKWLTDSYGFNITCYQVALAQDGDNEYLSATQVFPPRELAAQARRQGSLRSERANKFPEIEELLQSCQNQAAQAFFKGYIDKNWERNRRRDSLVFRTDKTRFRVKPSLYSARVHQMYRFLDDKSRWETKLSKAEIKDRGSDLLFHLHSEDDMKRFNDFIQEELPKVIWNSGSSPVD